MSRDAPAATVDLDEFRLVRVIGQGGMGSVYLGYDTVLERDVAIKLMRDVTTDEDARIRFLTEARAIARLDHPNVITVFRASTTRTGHPYIVQELVRGTSLDRVPLPVAPDRLVEIALGIARGLAAAHRRGILHRDVKPANVMIDDAGVPKLLDFGVAKLSTQDALPSTSLAGFRAAPAIALTARGSAEVATTLDLQPNRAVAATAIAAVAGPVTVVVPPPQERSPTPQTDAGTIVGTPRYMAPEIWCGDPATIRSDLYSLGALLYELATGMPPHAHADASSLGAAVVTGPAPRPVIELASGLAVELGDLIMACLARDPADRPESAAEVAYRCEHLLLGRPPLPDGNPYPGLAPFTDAHRAVFFGRGTDVSEVIDRLRSASLVVVAGDSGIGKSSLCRAGVIPAVCTGALGGQRTWEARTVNVGRHAVAALYDALQATGDDDAAAVDSARATWSTKTSGLLLLLDQFEELVTLNEAEEAERVAVMIARLAREVPGIKVLITVRGDLLTRVAALPALGPLMTYHLHLLRVLSVTDVRDAIVGPARAKGVRFENDALVNRLASSVEGQTGSLPLLSFALAELWERRDPERALIPRSALDEIGGVSGALARRADQVIGALGPDARIAARRIALLLVTREGTRAERDRHELCPDGDSAAAVALEALVQGRLVVARNAPSGEPEYELAHDSLIKEWATLAGWRDDVAGQRGLRVRLAAAASEWRQRGGGGHALWGRAQLRQVAKLDELSETDREFIAASRRAVRRRTVAAVTLLASLPAVAVVTWLVLQQRDQRERDREVKGYLEVAARYQQQAEAAGAAAERERAEAFRLFDSNAVAPAELVWERARTQLALARTASAATIVELEAAVLIDPSREELRRQIAGVTFDRAVLAELARDHDALRELEARLVAVDREGVHVSRWRRPASLELDAPGAASLAIRAYLPRDGRVELAAPVVTARGGSLSTTLPQGSYLLVLSGADGLVVHHPVVLARGESLVLSLPLPSMRDVPPDMVYVAAGRFLVGAASDEDLYRRDFLGATPLHVTATGAYLIAITEVTFADWMAYLRALPADERERRRPQVETMESTALALDGGHTPDEPFRLTLQPTTETFIAREREPIVFPDRDRRQSVKWEALPVTGISFEDAVAYAAWVSRTGRVPRARLCTALEWERAARGADGRTWPHGDRLDPDDANFDVTYGRQSLAFGPDEVGVRPQSASPYGLLDAVGNVWEWVAGVDGSALMRGGGWYHGAASAVTANVDVQDPKRRAVWAGLRICADPP